MGLKARSLLDIKQLNIQLNKLWIFEGRRLKCAYMCHCEETSWHINWMRNRTGGENRSQRLNALASWEGLVIENVSIL
jgi:hypothetical protein